MIRSSAESGTKGSEQFQGQWQDFENRQLKYDEV
jgi:hypothetical protein